MSSDLWKNHLTVATMTGRFRHAASQSQREVRIRTMTVDKQSHQPPPESTGGPTATPTGGPASVGPSANRGPDGRDRPIMDAPLIAVYTELHSPPLVVRVEGHSDAEEHMPALIDALTLRAYNIARDQGGRLPLEVFRELVENLVHASFAGVVVTILDHGNTVRVSDRGPGISDKDAALRPGFTSADGCSRRFIRGVGSGFSVVKDALAAMDGVLEIEDNLGQGTVVTVKCRPQPDTPLAPTSVPAYNLSERRLKTLLLAVELAPVGPTRVAQELGVSTSTAYRDLVFLEDAGFVISGESGHRSVTDGGLAYLDAVL
jgi:hypothetical protein